MNSNPSSPPSEQWLGYFVANNQNVLIHFNREWPDTKRQFIQLSDLNYPQFVWIKPLKLEVNKEEVVSLTGIEVFDKQTGALTPIEGFSSANFARYENLKIVVRRTDKDLIEGSLEGTLHGVQISGPIQLRKDWPVEIKPSEVSWNQYKLEVETQAGSGAFLYRGQGSTGQPLMTTYHRTGSLYMPDFYNFVLPKLRNMLFEHIPKYPNEESQDIETLGFARHHGFPTPVLDWSKCPYVAGFFAFSGIKRSDLNKKGSVRIYRFDKNAWQTDFKTLGKLGLRNLLNPAPVLCPLGASGNANPRHSAQKSEQMLSNFRNLEEFFHLTTIMSKRDFLKVYEIPWDERQRAIDDLRERNITPATMYPGLDGMCASLREEIYGAPG